MPIWFLILFFITFGASGIHVSVLGTAWPVMYEDLAVALSIAGYINMVKALGRVVSGFYNDKLVRRLGTYRTAVFGSFLVLISLIGFACSRSVWMLCLFFVPMGVGEVFFLCTLNAFVAVHFKTKYINWLNMLWSLSSTLGPYIMTLCLVRGGKWNLGYLILACIQLAMLLVFVSTYPQWKKIQPVEVGEVTETKRAAVSPIRLNGMAILVVAQFSYMAIENVSGLWTSSYLAVQKGLNDEMAAMGTTFLFLGMTVGRFFCGFLSDRFHDKKMMNLGQTVVVIAGLVLAFSSGGYMLLLGFGLLGLGCAPIYPCFNHYVPQVVGVENTSAAMGFLMGCSQFATLLLPMIFGWISALGGMWLFPFMQAFFALVMMVMLRFLHVRRSNI